MSPPLDNAESARRAKRWLWLALGLFFALTAFHPSYISEPAIDFKCYFVASRCWSSGGNPYDFEQVVATAAEREETSGTLYPYLYPPTLAILLSLLGELPLWWASFLWHLFSVALTVVAVATAITLCQILLPRDARTPNTSPTDDSRSELFLPLVAVGLLFVLPFNMQFAWGQANVLVMLLILLALVQSFGRQAELSAGALLACAALIKFTPAYLLLYFACQRRWKVVVGFVLSAALLATPMLLIPSGRVAWRQFFEFLPSTGYGRTIAGLNPPLGPANFSVAGFFARLTTNEQLVAGLTYVSLGLLVALIVAMHYRLRGATGERLLLLPHLIVMVVAAPYAYLHHVTFIYPGVLLTAYALWSLPARRGERPLVYFALATLLASILFPRLYGLTGLHYAFRSFNLLGLAAMYLLGLWAAELWKATPLAAPQRDSSPRTAPTAS